MVSMLLNSLGPLSVISVVRHRTVVERIEIRKVCADLEARKAKGETNITIRYKNRIRFIVKNLYDIGFVKHSTRNYSTL